jgi:hypothetical protein
VVLLISFGSLYGFIKPQQMSIKVWKQHMGRRDEKPVDIIVTQIIRHTVGDRAHNCLVKSVA